MFPYPLTPSMPTKSSITITLPQKSLVLPVKNTAVSAVSSYITRQYLIPFISSSLFIKYNRPRVVKLTDSVSAANFIRVLIALAPVRKHAVVVLGVIIGCSAGAVALLLSVGGWSSGNSAGEEDRDEGGEELHFDFGLVLVVGRMWMRLRKCGLLFWKWRLDCWMMVIDAVWWGIEKWKIVLNIYYFKVHRNSSVEAILMLRSWTWSSAFKIQATCSPFLEDACIPSLG